MVILLCFNMFAIFTNTIDNKIFWISENIFPADFQQSRISYPGVKFSLLKIEVLLNYRYLKKKKKKKKSKLIKKIQTSLEPMKNTAWKKRVFQAIFFMAIRPWKTHCYIKIIVHLSHKIDCYWISHSETLTLRGDDQEQHLVETLLNKIQLISFWVSLQIFFYQLQFQNYKYFKLHTDFK